MRVKVTSDLLMDKYDGASTKSPDWYVGYLAGAGEYIVPGITGWDEMNVHVNTTGTGDVTVIIDAFVTADEFVESGEWAGQIVNDRWVSEYIRGAGEYWLAPGVLMPTEVVVTSDELAA